MSQSFTNFTWQDRNLDSSEKTPAHFNRWISRRLTTHKLVSSRAMAVPTLRIARPTDDMAALMPFYRDGLGLSVLASFDDHAGFDGVILGVPRGPYHLEFTHARHGPKVGRAPTHDNLLVLYLPEREVWESTVERMRKVGAKQVESFNPYWDKQGVTFEDADGWRVVLQGASWNA